MACVCLRVIIIIIIIIQILLKEHITMNRILKRVLVLVHIMERKYLGIGEIVWLLI